MESEALNHMWTKGLAEEGFGNRTDFSGNTLVSATYKLSRSTGQVVSQSKRTSAKGSLRRQSVGPNASQPVMDISQVHILLQISQVIYLQVLMSETVAVADPFPINNVCPLR